MELHQLRCFLAAADDLHFGRAAQRLHMLPSALGRHIRLLEEDLGTQLFARTTRAVSLTEDGSTLVGEARALLDQVEAIERRYREKQRARKTRRFRIGAMDSAAAGLLPPLMADVHSKYPDIAIQLLEEKTIKLLPKAGAGAILDLTVHDADLLRFILGDEPVSVAAFSQNGGLASGGVEDAALTLIRFRSGLLAQLFDGFTTGYAETAVEIHGTDGSLFARDCMSQTPRGTLTLRSAAGEETIALDHHNYYVPGIRAFHDAVRGVGRPASSGEDGLVSLATALAALESARDGRSVAIKLEA